MSWGNYSQYKTLTISERKEKASKIRQKLQKKTPDIEPIICDSRNISTSWWGKSWNKNLASYQDFFYRLDRGRSYLRAGCVVDLKIMPGLLKAKIIGSSDEIYSCTIHINKIDSKIWRNIKTIISKDISNIEDFLKGKITFELQGLLLNNKTGLFPSPHDIKFDCNCLDYADLCKHAAAALYGVSVRLDSKPDLFFTLRQVNLEEIINEITNKIEITDKAKKQNNSKIIGDANLSETFGIDIEE